MSKGCFDLVYNLISGLVTLVDEGNGLHLGRSNYEFPFMVVFLKLIKMGLNVFCCASEA